MRYVRVPSKMRLFARRTSIHAATADHPLHIVRTSAPDRHIQAVFMIILDIGDAEKGAGH